MTVARRGAIGVPLSTHLCSSTESKPNQPHPYPNPNPKRDPHAWLLGR